MQFYNMDETPCYFDMASDQPVHFDCDINVDDIDTGHRKSRFTVTLCCCAYESMVRNLIVFKECTKTKICLITMKLHCHKLPFTVTR